jgi:hypothetical protein
MAYGLPDVLGRHRAVYEGSATLVVGAGHSAANVLIQLVQLARRDPLDERRLGGARNQGGAADQLPARGELGAHVKDLVNGGKITLISVLPPGHIWLRDAWEQALEALEDYSTLTIALDETWPPNSEEDFRDEAAAACQNARYRVERRIREALADGELIGLIIVGNSPLSH